MKRILIFLSLFSLSFVLASSSEKLSVKEHYERSYAYEKVGKYRDAIEAMLPLYKVYSDGYTINLRLGWLFFLNGNYNDAIKHYTHAIKSTPDAFSPRLGLMRVYLANYSYNKVQTTATYILKHDYYNYYANLYLSQALTAQKKYDVAIETVKKMLQRYPTDIAYLEQLLILYKETQSPYYNDLFEDLRILRPQEHIN